MLTDDSEGDFEVPNEEDEFRNNFDMRDAFYFRAAKYKVDASKSKHEKIKKKMIFEDQIEEYKKRYSRSDPDKDDLNKEDKNKKSNHKKYTKEKWLSLAP